MMFGSASVWLRPVSGRRWPSISTSVPFEALAPRPWIVGAKVPEASALPKPPWAALPKPVTAGTFCRICCTVCAPVSPMSSRPTVIRLLPTGAAPRMLVPVIVISSRASSPAGAAACAAIALAEAAAMMRPATVAAIAALPGLRAWAPTADLVIVLSTLKYPP